MDNRIAREKPLGRQRSKLWIGGVLILCLVVPNIAAAKKRRGKSYLCYPPRGCKMGAIPKSDPRRHRYDKHIEQAAELFGLPPALLKSQIHAETSLRSPTIENIPEKRAYKRNPHRLSKYLRAYKWGKGLGQFGAVNAHLYGLAWDPKDIGKEVTVQKFGFPQKMVLRDIFDPGAAIEAKAMYFREMLDSNFIFKVKTSKKRAVRNKWTHAFSDYIRIAEVYRALAAAYNRGPNRIARATKLYYSRNGRLPKKYVELLTLRYMRRFRITRCHVARIAGLCDNLTGIFTIYQKDFKYRAKNQLHEEARIQFLDHQFRRGYISLKDYEQGCKKILKGASVPFVAQKVKGRLGVLEKTAANFKILEQKHKKETFNALVQVFPTEYVRMVETESLIKGVSEYHRRQSVAVIFSRLFKKTLGHPQFNPKEKERFRYFYFWASELGSQGSAFQEIAEFLETNPKSIYAQDLFQQFYRPVALREVMPMLKEKMQNPRALASVDEMEELESLNRLEVQFGEKDVP